MRYLSSAPPASRRPLPPSSLLALLGLTLTVLGSPAVAWEAPSENEAPMNPRWIWSAAPRLAGQTVTLERTLQVDPTEQDRLRAGQSRWRLVGGAEFCRVEISCNGELLAVVPPYHGPFALDLTEALLEHGRSDPASALPAKPSAATLAIRASSVPGPAALFLQLQVVDATGETHSRWSTNRDWQSAGNPEQALVDYGAVEPEPWLSRERPVGINAVDDYTQWTQALGESGADPARYDLPEGFTLERLRAAKEGEDSWVSMTFDPAGRLLVGMEQKGILRFDLQHSEEPPPPDRIAEELLECRGLVFHGNHLYLNANNSKALYVMPYDSDSHEFTGPARQVRATTGGVGHGRNDLAVGPDGWLYSMHGDAVDIPRDAHDWTSPLREHRRGQNTREGHLLRLSPRGGQWEIISAGLRNPYGIAFNRDGEAFTYDADAEFDMGAPWYRPTRVVHLTSGADYGWRGVTGSWPPYYPDHPDNAPPFLDIGKGSPTAVEFGSHSRFPASYRNSLFVLEWAYGRILAVHMQPQGAGYVARAETFLKGRPLNVTDLAFGPDGHLYFITGGRKTQSALFRVKATEPSDHGPEGESPTLQARARERFGRTSRELRRSLELLHRPSPEGTVDYLWPFLDNADPRIRHAARVALEHQELASWRERAFNAPVSSGTLEALLVLCRSPEPSDRARAFQKVLDADLASLSDSDLNRALHVLQSTLEEATRSDPASPKTLGDKLSALYPRAVVSLEHPPVNQRLSDLLARCNHPEVVPKTLAHLAPDLPQGEQLHYLFVLRNVSSGWNAERWRMYFELLAQADRFLGGQGMPGFLEKTREEASATANAGGAVTQKQIDRWLAGPDLDAQPTLETRPLVRKWSIADFLDLPTTASSAQRVERGREVFHEALCSRCHRVGTEGTLLGPDLSAVGRRFSQTDILRSILEPSRVVAENYRSVQVRTRDGKVHSGRLVLGGDYRSPKLRIQTDPLRGNSTLEIPKDQVEQLQETTESWMPSGLLDTFPRDDILSLLVFLSG